VQGVGCRVCLCGSKMRLEFIRRLAGIALGGKDLAV
jgi:hypothetical protein